MCRTVVLEYTHCGHRDAQRHITCGKFLSDNECKRAKAEGLKVNYRNEPCSACMKESAHKARDEAEREKGEEERLKKLKEGEKAKPTKKTTGKGTGKGVGKRNQPVPANKGLPKTMGLGAGKKPAGTGGRGGKGAIGGLMPPATKPGGKQLPHATGRGAAPPPGREGKCIETTSKGKLCEKKAMSLSRYCSYHQKPIPKDESS